jgi:hypothetical protein
MLIQRGQEFVTQQKLDELKKRVIPTSELSDPLIDNPIRVEGFDWKNGELILELSQAPNPRWIMTLRNLRSFGGVGNTEPSTVSIQGTEARIPAPERVAEITYNYVRQWISRTNDDYATEQKRMLRENEERERRELQAAVQRAEESKAERARVLERLTRQSR